MEQLEMMHQFNYQQLWRGQAAVGRLSALAVWALGLGVGEVVRGAGSGSSWAGPVATAESWPMFRGGPSLTGVSPSQIPDRLALRWRIQTGGAIKSSPAIDGGRVFVGSNDGKLYAIDLAQGTQLWVFETKGGIESSPLILNQKVYIGSSDAFLYALDVKSGELAWKYETGDRILGAPNWVRQSDGRAAILVGSYDFNLHSVDAGTGKSNWVYETGNYINGSPAVFEGKTVFGGCDALLHVIGLEKGEKLKEIEAGAYIAGSAAFDRGRAYVGHYENEFLCADLEAGRIVWRFKDRAFPYFSTPALAPDRVVFGGRDKRVHCVNRATGESVWQFATQGKVDSSPVIAGAKVAVGSDDGRLYVLSLKDGSELWSYEIGQSVTSSPAVAGGWLVIGADDGYLYAFGEAATERKP